MVLCGIALLISALKPIKNIGARKNQAGHGWRTLYHFILLLTGGYLLFGYHLIKGGATFNELVAAAALLGSGCFIFMASRLSLKSICDLNDAVQVERYRALHDPLTSLPNRILFYERIDHALSFAKREKKEIAIMIIDLNEFKEVNDTLGHQAGDTLLLQASQRLKSLLRESDTLARFGGDEFAIILPQTETMQAYKLAERLTSAILEPFTIERKSLTIGMSVGISMYPRHGSDSNTLIKHADIAMYSAKRYQKSFLLFKEEMQEEPGVNLDLNLNLDLAHAASLQGQQHAAANEKRVLN